MEIEEDSVILRGYILPIVDWSKFNKEGKEGHYIQINHNVGKLSGNKKITDETIVKAEFAFLLDLKSLISKSAIDPELTRVSGSMRREDRETTHDKYRSVFDKLSITRDDQIVVPVDLRRRLLDILHFGHCNGCLIPSIDQTLRRPEFGARHCGSLSNTACFVD